MPYILKRTDQGGGFVAQSGSLESYTTNILKAMKFETKQSAENDRCPENEIILNLADFLR